MERGPLMRMFIFGYGFSSAAAAAAVKERTDSVCFSCTVRSEEKAQRLEAAKIVAHLFDGSKPGPTLGASLRHSTHVVLSIPPGEAGDPALVHHRADLDAAPL